MTAIFKDISARNALEALHLRTERLEAVPEIAASLAHEIKNPLASIRSAVQQLARSAPAGEDERVLSGLVIRESDRLSRLLTEFLDFSRVRVTNSAPLDLAAVAEGGIRLVRQHPDCPAAARITLVASGRPIAIEGDDDLLHRVVFNLVLNAVQAAPANADVTVEVAVPDGPACRRCSHRAAAAAAGERPRPGVAPDILPPVRAFTTGSRRHRLGLAIGSGRAGPPRLTSATRWRNRAPHSLSTSGRGSAPRRSPDTNAPRSWWW